jgi:outer membrane protein
MISISKIALACAALVAASGAFAQKAGDDIISTGVAFINTDASVGTLTHSNAGLTPRLVGTSAVISNESTVTFGWLHMYSDNIGAEFTLGIPPTVTQDLTTPNTPAIGLPANHPAAAKLDIWTPTAIGKYFFGSANDQWRPYLGLGVSRVSFHNIKTDPGVSTLAGVSANLSSSWAPVYNAGVVYNIDAKWSVSGSVSYIPVTTTATFVGSTGTTTGDIKLKATDYVVKMGYRF